jgi:hypothetical protein
MVKLVRAQVNDVSFCLATVRLVVASAVSTDS